jgi:hypothetical protein
VRRHAGHAVGLAGACAAAVTIVVAVERAPLVSLTVSTTGYTPLTAYR